MSLESSVADLTTASTALLAEVRGKMASIDQSVAKAIAAVPSMSKTFYVDPIAGVDTADGSAAAPLKTIQKAVSNTPVGGVCKVLLTADYTLDNNVSIDLRCLDIGSSVAGTKRKLTLTYGLSSDGSPRLNGFTFANGAALMLGDLIPVLPSQAGVSPTSFNNSMFKTGSSGSTPSLGVKLSNCDVQSAADSTATLFVLLSSAIIFEAVGSTFPANFGGRYIGGIASGTAVNTHNNILSNLTTL